MGLGILIPIIGENVSLPLHRWHGQIMNFANVLFIGRKRQKVLAWSFFRYWGSNGVEPMSQITGHDYLLVLGMLSKAGAGNYLWTQMPHGQVITILFISDKLLKG